MRKALMVVLACLMVSGCVTTQEIQFGQRCSELIPASYLVAVPGAAIPAMDGDDQWFDFGVRQTEQLGKANRRPQEMIDIIQKCELRDRSIVVKTKHRILK